MHVCIPEVVSVAYASMIFFLITRELSHLWNLSFRQSRQIVRSETWFQLYYKFYSTFNMVKQILNYFPFHFNFTPLISFKISFIAWYSCFSWYLERFMGLSGAHAFCQLYKWLQSALSGPIQWKEPLFVYAIHRKSSIGSWSWRNTLDEQHTEPFEFGELYRIFGRSTTWFWGVE